MRWEYNDSYRDKFQTWEHRDILIVPHATTVTPVEGGPPKVVSKVPVMNTQVTPNQPIPGKFMPVEFTITNDDIYKEKFEYTNSLDTNEDLAFCGCESAMVKFTIRNKKTYNEISQQYELDIPNLEHYVLIPDPSDPDAKNLPTVVGEVQTHYIIKVYIYYNGDSSTLIYLGMFVVEQDKVSSDGYTRDITAFDFLYQFRELDVHNWYVHLFRGINKKDNDLTSYFENRTPGIKPDSIPQEDWDAGWIRKPKDKWTIKEMLEDLIKNLMTRYPSEKTVTNQETDKHDYTDPEKKGQPGVKDIVSNYYEDDSEPYTGLALPMILDPDLTDPTKKYSIPKEADENAHECYGYMPILELPVYEDPKIMDSKALSAGKFLEDIGALSGRYPYIRLDRIQDDNYAALSPSIYEDPTSSNYHPYNLYEKCILTFKPLPKNDEPIVSNNIFDNKDIAKGFKHDYSMVDTVYIWQIHTRFEDDLDSEKARIEYANLTKQQNLVKTNHPDLVKKLSTVGNMFVDYLAIKEDDIKFAKRNDDTPQPNKTTVLTNYAEVLELLQKGKPGYNLQEDGDALLHEGYKRIKYRTYTPYELTTFADPVREVGDRIRISFEDKVTGEITEFDTYILSRKISGIQKMMDTYVAKGNVATQTFSNYKTGATYAPQTMGYYGSGSGGTSVAAGGTTFTGLTKDDFVEIIRNIGFRLLDEPTSVVARFVATSSSTEYDVRILGSPSNVIDNYPTATIIHDGDTTNPIQALDFETGTTVSQYNVSAGDYWVVTYNDQEGTGTEYPFYTQSPLYVFDGSKWVYVGSYDSCGDCDKFTSSPIGYNDSGDLIINEIYNGDISEGSKCLTLHIDAYDDEDNDYAHPNNISKSQIDYTQFYNYSSSHDGALSPILTVDVKYGDYINAVNQDHTNTDWMYQYPGFWYDYRSANYTYPKRHVSYTDKPHVELKWSDPDNISSWEPKPCAWEGTVIIRKRNAAPLHRWDGELIVDSTTKDAYKDTAFIDDTIQLNRTYYYGFFPYYTAYTEDGHAIKYYRFTKTVRVSTGTTIDAPEILSIERIS